MNQSQTFAFFLLRGELSNMDWIVDFVIEEDQFY